MRSESDSHRNSQADDLTPNRDPLGRGRPRTLTDAKRREICALIAGGCGLQEAAKYLRCGINTIRPEAGVFGARQARQLFGKILNVVSSETSDPFKFERIEKRVRGTFEYYIRAACDRRRRADPLAALGITVPDFDTMLKPKPAAVNPNRRAPSAPTPPPSEGFQTSNSNPQ